MRVVHLSSVDLEGGSSKSAFRLHQGLVASGIDSRMLVGRKVSLDETVHLAPTPEPEAPFYWSMIERSYLHPRRTTVSNTWFSIGYPGVDVSKDPLIQSADVIHLHWVAAFIAPGSLARLGMLGKPMVWTLHDQRPFTGGCHFSAGCRGYEKDCRHCPQLANDIHEVPAANLADQLRLVPARAITIVAPSQWLADCARHSAMFARSGVETIPYGIQTDRFLPQPRLEARQQLGWPAEGFHIVFGADYGDERRKGFRELAAALQLCWNNPDFRSRVRTGLVRLSVFGRTSPEITRLPIPINFCGYVNSEARLAKMYAAADLYILPSLEDNFPNTALEAMSCGTPILAFKIGGVPDLVMEGLNGRLVPAGDSVALSEALLAILANPQQCESWRASCRDRIVRNFSLAAQTRRYVSLYENLGAAAPVTNIAGLPGPVSPGDLPINGDAAPHLQSTRAQLLLASLEHFASNTKRATAAQREACRELINCLREQCANPAAARDLARQRLQNELESGLMAQEALRQSRKEEQRRRSLARREILSRIFGKRRRWTQEA